MNAASAPRDPSAADPVRWGYIMPAEWSPHEGTWISWPHNPDTWPGHLAEVEAFYVELIAAIARDEFVHINVQDENRRDQIQKLFAENPFRDHIRTWVIRTNDAWCRDYGPTVVIRRGGPTTMPTRLGIDWQYNAWGGKYPPYDDDNAAARRMAAAIGLDCLSGGLFVEGGALDVNGDGWLLTTASCLLNPNRNRDVSREFLEDRLRAMLGVREILWLGGSLAGDDTDGHIDNLVRFVGPRTVATVWERDPRDENYAGLNENLQWLRSWRSADGDPLEVLTLPTPDPILVNSRRLPASYANFYFTNGSVLVPQYQCPQDQIACDVLARCFPNRRIVGLDCTWAIHGLGAIHCLTQQIPSAGPPRAQPSS
ncbi:MAG TPA: agmatine deiminase family protein [Pirellulaceae bacterium]